MARMDLAQQVIDDLASAPWFSQVGAFVERPGMRAVGTWGRALALSKSIAWECACLELSNGLGAVLQGVSKDLYNTWNDAVGVLRPRVVLAIGAPIQRYLVEHNLPDSILTGIQYNALFVALEAYYSDSVAQGMAATVGALYLEGFFPCGWEGLAPRGELLVY
jgi:hypothetical protein